MKYNDVKFSKLTTQEEEILKNLEKEFTQKINKDLYLLAFDKNPKG